LASLPTTLIRHTAVESAAVELIVPEELRAFRETVSKRELREFLACELFLDTMLRVSELASADVEDLVGPDGAGRYTLDVRVKGGAKKGTPVSPEVFGAVCEYLKTRGKLKGTDPLLVNREGQRWTRSALTQMVGRVARAAGITRFSVSAHKLRHTSATVALTAGVNPLAVSKLLGHSSMRTTEQYLHLIPTALHEARDAQRLGMAAYVGRA
jgi:integrase/recombinase XerC/integrase/recombinase XerD